MNSIGELLRSFLIDYLPIHRGLRPSSIKSYRDALRLFLLYVSEYLKCRITKLEIGHITMENIIGFLAWLENHRKSSVRTRNHRLAALHCFCEYIATRIPEFAAEAERIRSIAVKRTPPPETFFLEQDEVKSVFKSMSSNRDRLSLRDQALLLFMYNTGARVQEIADLRIEQLDFEVLRVRLHGKGDKWRMCPMWKETAAAIRAMFSDLSRAPNDPVFQASNGLPLTRFGIYKIVRKHTAAIHKRRGNGTAKAISPHMWRHTMAVHMVESGVEVNVIRAWLGHVSLETTNRYAEINMRTKEAALATCNPPVANSAFHRSVRWRDDKDLLKWLDSL
jgi:site-specific recombinase XerD